MIRINLSSDKSTGVAAAGKCLRFIAMAIFVAQMILFGLSLQQAGQQEKKFHSAVARRETLKGEVQKYVIDSDQEKLAGRVAARNNWHHDRKASPLNLLARLQKDCPNNIRFMAFSADLTAGKIVLSAPDLNSVSTWLNSHFGGKGSISVAGRENNLLLIDFVWSG